MHVKLHKAESSASYFQTKLLIVTDFQTISTTLQERLEGIRKRSGVEGEGFSSLLHFLCSQSKTP